MHNLIPKVVTMLSPRQTLLIKVSWSYLSGRLEEFGDTFYRILFDLEPSLRGMFKNDIATQQEKFSAMVNHIVAHIQHTPELGTELSHLGHRHVDYGVEARHYDTMMIAFLLALEKRLKRKWDNETKEAWTMAFVYVVSQMRRPMKASLK
jgi:hemoglobin-like flavoprotein